MSQRVLIVDDSLTVRMDLAEAFESAGFAVVLCDCGAEARRALAQQAVDALVLDVLLPDADGVELLSELSRLPAARDAVRVLLSSEADVRDRIRGLETGAHEYVGKPYDASWVVARVSELLRGRQAAEPAAPRVLVIDDSPTFRHELQSVLEGAGYDVTTAASGEEGLRLAAAQRPSAMIVDGVLPGIDGPTVIRRARLDATLRAVPCILLTSAEQKSAELSALDAGADAFVRKGEHRDIVLAKLDAALRRSSGEAIGDATSSLLGPKRVMAVDDDPGRLQALGDVLRAQGYDVILARQGEEALELLAVQPVDCVLLDMQMPGLGGEETCARIKAAPAIRDTPVVLLSERGEEEAILRGLAAGADDCIAKNSELGVLEARVRALLRRKQLEDETRHIREQHLRHELELAEARAARELAEARAVLVEELEAKNEELEAFSYSVSHDLRAPLRSIDGFSQALLEDYEALLDDRGKDYLRRVRAAAQRMGELIDALLQLSRVGRAELVKSRVNLTELAERVVTELRNREPDKNVRVELEPELWANADRRLMTALLDNLLGNAWKFSGGRADAEIRLAAGEQRGVVVYRVSDNGVGFDPAYAERLFRPFQRLHSLSEFPGTGIGLATVHRIVERHGGRIWAESALGQGATFHFTLGRSP